MHIALCTSVCAPLCVPRDRPATLMATPGSANAISSSRRAVSDSNSKSLSRAYLALYTVPAGSVLRPLPCIPPNLNPYPTPLSLTSRHLYWDSYHDMPLAVVAASTGYFDWHCGPMAPSSPPRMISPILAFLEPKPARSPLLALLPCPSSPQLRETRIPESEYKTMDNGLK